MATVTCPRCGTDVPKYLQYPSWCTCGWNVEPTLPDSKAARKMYRSGQQLFQKFSRQGRPGVFPDIFTVWGSVFFMVALTFLLLYAAVSLLLVHFFLTRAVGGLLLLGVIGLLTPLVLIRPRLCQPVQSLRDFPALAHWMKAAQAEVGGKAVTHLQITGAFEIRIQSTVLGRRCVLQIGAPLLMVLDRDTFTAGVLRELCLTAVRHRYGLDYGAWARNALSVFTNLLAEEGFRRDPWQTGAGTRVRAPVVNQWARLLLLPVALIPYLLWWLSSKPWFRMEQRSVYEGNARAAAVCSMQALEEFLQVLSLEDKVMFSLSGMASTTSYDARQYGIRERVQELPGRELERLMLSGLEGSPSRPSLQWQREVLRTNAFQVCKVMVPELDWTMAGVEIRQSLVIRG